MTEHLGALERRDDIVDALRKSLSTTEHGLGSVPNFVKVVIRDEMWRDRVIRETGERAAFGSFADLVTTPPLAGLGASLDQLRGLCKRDPEALDAIDRATAGRQGERTDLVDNINEVDRPTGTAAATALRRLRKDRPDLHAEVMAGRRTAHGAMVAAGFRKKTATVPLTVQGIRRAISKLSEGEQAKLRAWAANGWLP